MIKRWLFCALCAALGAAGGALLGIFAGFSNTQGLSHVAVWGAVLGLLAWLALDSFYALRWLRWLQQEQRRDFSPSATGEISLRTTPPRLLGIWGQIASRTQRVLKINHQHLAESQARLDDFLAALQVSPNGVVLLDSQGRIEWCNFTAQQHFGLDARRDVLQYMANLVREPAFKAYMEAANFAGDVLVPGRLNTPQRPVILSVQVFAYGENRQLLLSRDTTALELAEAMRRDFVANVSHEIRTPLTVLAGFIETLQTLPLNEADRSRYLALMHQQSQRMQTLVSDLLILSRLEGSPFPGSTEWVTVRALLAQCEQDARALSMVLAQAQPLQKQHTLVFQEGPPCEIAGNQTELVSAWFNLIANALRYTPSTGSVQVAWRLLPGGRGEFSVRDTGPGIASEHIPRLTERFYRVDLSRSRETGGTGLGLAIVKHIAQRHGAVLAIDSQLGKGACFSIVFPAGRTRLVATKPLESSQGENLLSN